MFGGSSSYGSKYEYKVVSSEVLALVPTNLPVLKWTEMVIAFS